jgi:hypothetical protein
MTKHELPVAEDEDLEQYQQHKLNLENKRQTRTILCFVILFLMLLAERYYRKPLLLYSLKELIPKMQEETISINFWLFI